MIASRVLSLAQELLRIPSLTPTAPELLPAAQATLDVLERHAQASGAHTVRLAASGGHTKWGYTVDNLYAEWSKGAPQRSLCFIGHTDVVAPGHGESWSAPPFAGEIRDGFLYGRGATDMKGAVAAFFTAVEEALPNHDGVRVAAIITTDEEWAAINGARHVLRWLKQENKGYDAFLVGEPSSRDKLGTHVKIGRRGSLVGRLVASGVQGHAAYPQSFVNPNRALTLASTILQGLTWDDATPSMPATQFQPVALQSGGFQASAIIPGQAEALWNIRFTPRQKPEDLVARLQTALAEPPGWALGHPDAALLAQVSVHGNMDTVSQPYLSQPGPLTATTLSAIVEVVGLEPVLDCTGGTTDGRFVPMFFPEAEIVELGPPECGGMGPGDDSYGQKGGMHQADERIALDDLAGLQRIYRVLLEKYAG
jgi:succinyl-diaminopimelate desuccinylase